MRVTQRPGEPFISLGKFCFDVAFCVVVNNVARGAWGAAMLNAEYWAYLRNRKPGESAFGNDE